jgi:hypothetical protein
MYTGYMHMVQSDRKCASPSSRCGRRTEKVEVFRYPTRCSKASKWEALFAKVEKYDKFVYSLENDTDVYRLED